MTLVEALEQNVPNIFISKSAFMNGEKIWVRQIGWSKDGSGDIEYKDSRVEEFRFKKETRMENTVTLELENGSSLQLDQYGDQEAEKQKILRECG